VCQKLFSSILGYTTKTLRNGLDWLKRTLKATPSPRKILNYIKSVEKLWNKVGKKVLREISKVTSLKWKSKVIHCYVVGKCVPFSDPLTLPIYKEKDYFIDVLIHELIHQIFLKTWRKQTKQ
jgi:hypothetical protein